MIKNILQILALILFTMPNSATAATVQADLAGIIGSGQLKIAMAAADLPPYINMGQDRDLSGREREIAQDIAQELQVELEIIAAKTFSEVIELVASGQAHVGLSNLTITTDRAQKVIFTKSYRQLGTTLVLNRLQLAAKGLAAGMEHMAELKETDGKLAIIGGSSYEAAARFHFPKAELVNYPSYRPMLIDLAAGKLLIAGGNSGTINHLLKEMPNLNIKLQSFSVSTRLDHIAMAVAPGNDHLLAWLNSYITIRGEKLK
ncbi:MAG: transporter substrate-binding domain-containing protein [Thermodesulfobacteriota bacterium]